MSITTSPTAPTGEYRTAMPNVIALPGLPAMVPAARVAVRNLLRTCPRVDDAESITSELVTNAILYSTSTSHTFGLSLDVRKNWLRIEVTDAGPEPLPSEDPPPPPPPSPSPSPALLPPPPAPAPATPTLLPHPDNHTDEDIDPDIDADYSRGLTIIRSLSDRWGQDRYPDHSIWWSELVWTDPSDADG